MTVLYIALICIATVAMVAGSESARAESSGRSYVKLALCPKSTDGDILRTLSVSSVRHCAIYCDQTERCERFSLPSPSPSAAIEGSALCYLGDNAVILALQWTPGDCQTFATRESINLTPEFELLQMKLMYNFRVGGLTNLASPGLFTLTANDVTIGSNGAEFKGNTGSYLSTATPNFQQFLDYGTQFSFFVQVRHTMSSTIAQNYVRLIMCSGGTDFGNQFGKSASNNFFETTRFTFGSDYKQVTGNSLGVVPNDAAQHLITVGFTFNRTQVDQYFFNGSMIDLYSRVPSNPGQFVPTDRFQCLTLGYSNNGNSCLNGTMRCFGLSTKILSLVEFRQLEAYCLS